MNEAALSFKAAVMDFLAALEDEGLSADEANEWMQELIVMAWGDWDYEPKALEETEG